MSKERTDESGTGQNSPHAKERTQKRDETVNGSMEGSLDKSKEGMVTESTHKNILKLGQRETVKKNITAKRNSSTNQSSIQQDEADANSRKEYFKNITKIPKFSYVELSEFWKQHKNSIEKEQKDIPPICYESKSLFDLISYTANMPESSDARQWKEILEEYKNGMRNHDQFGYQYNQGNFPVMFQ